jgi:hypothetical protein
MERQGRDDSCIKGIAINIILALYSFFARPLYIWKPNLRVRRFIISLLRRK